MKVLRPAIALALIVQTLMAPQPGPAWTVADPAGVVAPYLQARDAGSVGAVAGQATGDPPRASAPPVPYEGVSVMLVPDTPELGAQLGDIRAHARDSLTRYMEATADVADALAGYERTLITAGGGELIRGEVSNARGLAQLAEVPAGKWLLLAWRSQPHGGKSPKLRREDTAAFREMTVTSGYSIVTYWLLPLVVQPGQTTEVDLNDRNVWLTGVRAEHRIVEGQPKNATGKRH